MSDIQKTETYWSRMVQQAREERAQERALTTLERPVQVRAKTEEKADGESERAKQGRRSGLRQ
jgi:hypothetical protein